MRKKYFLFVLGLVFALTAAPADEKESVPNLMIVVDSSASMFEPTAGGQRKLQAVKEALGDLVGGLPGDINVGMIAFGHRGGKKYGHNDIEMVIPIGLLDAAVVRRELSLLQPRGLSPLAGSLRKAGECLINVKGRSCILLVTDGRETCGGDPVETARWIRENLKIGVVINVVGLDVAEVARGQLEDIAGAGGGRYYAVERPDDMAVTLVRAAGQKATMWFRRSKKRGMEKRIGRAKKGYRISTGRTQEHGKVSGSGPGKLMLHYVRMAPQSITIYDQETGEEAAGGGMWVHLEHSFKTSLKAGVYRLEIRRRGRSEPVSIKNVVIKGNRETSVNLD